MEILPIIIFIIVWYLIASFYKKKGYKAIIRHLTGFFVGLLGFIVSIVIIMPQSDANSDKSEIIEEKPHKEQNSDTPLEKENKEKSDEQSKTVTVLPQDQLSTSQPQSQEQSLTSQTNQKDEQTLELNINQFVTRLNKSLANAQSPFKITNKPKITEGAVNDVVQHMFTDNFVLIITLDKSTHKVKSLMTIISPSADNSNENLVMLFSNAAVLSAFEGDNEIKTLGKRLVNLTTTVMTEYGNTKKDIVKNIIYNGKKYTISVSQYTGIMSSAGFDE